MNNPRMPLREVLLSHPEWKRQYLENLKMIAEGLKWEKLGPIVEQHRKLIDEEVALDTRKLFSTEDFLTATDGTNPDKNDTGLRAFAEKRSEFLLNHELIKGL